MKALQDCLELIEKLVYPGSIYEFEQSTKEAIKFKKEALKKSMDIHTRALCIDHLCNQLYETASIRDKDRIKRIKAIMKDMLEI